MTIIKKFDTTEGKKGLPKKYLSLVVVFFFVLILFEIWINNNSLMYGDKLQKLISLAKTITLENQILENEIAKQQSLNNVASQSAELGFALPESIQYIR